MFLPGNRNRLKTVDVNPGRNRMILIIPAVPDHRIYSSPLSIMNKHPNPLTQQVVHRQPDITFNSQGITNDGNRIKRIGAIGLKGEFLMGL
jgi:hypothetical protein